MRSETGTWFAPPGRATADELQHAAAAVKKASLLRQVLDGFPGFAVVVNEQRQIVAANGRFLDALGASALDRVLGQRPGEAVGCREARLAPNGCGTAQACRYCAAHTMLEVQANGKPASRECHIPAELAQGGALDLEVLVSPMFLEGSALLLVAMRDISDDKRRRALERVFFRDVVKTADAVKQAAELLVIGGSDLGDSQRALLIDSAERLVEEIRAHQLLGRAEEGELRPSVRSVDLGALLQETVELYRNHELGAGRKVELEPWVAGDVESDPSLLSRVLRNLLENALEATPPGGSVTVSAEARRDDVTIVVRNSGCMPDDVRAQVFRRTFSTKEPGRGLGTYCIKLLGEHYLGGSVSFDSSVEQGTVFRLNLPRTWAGVQDP